MFWKRLPDVIEEAGIGIAQLSLDGRIEEANCAFAFMLGRTIEDLVGLHWSDTIHPGDHAMAWAVHQDARQGKHGYCDCRGLRPDGTTIDQAITVIGVRPSPEEEISRFFCVRQDISAHRVAQSQFALAVDLAPVGVLILDRTGTILMANKAIERLFGYRREELICSQVEMLLPVGTRERHLHHREHFNKDSYVKAMGGRDLVGRRSDGAEIPVQVYLNVLETTSSQVMLCTVIDIEPRLRYEEQLQLARQAAESASRAKSDFLARMSHEIRTPMNLIMGMNSLLLETPLTPLQREYVEMSYRNVRRLVRLTNGILDLSKVEAGMLTLESRLFDIYNLVTEALATMGAAAERKGLAMYSEMDSSVGRWWVGDPERIVQILLNLLGNAIKFTTEGVVRVRVSPVERDGKKGLSIHVDDTGCGVTDEQARVIFEAFQQADSSLNRKFEGSGLGLTICKSLCMLMGGDIEVVKKSSPGMLVRVTIFPRPGAPLEVESTSAHGKRLPAPKVPQGMKILLAEDNPENAFLVRAYLDGLGVLLDYAEDGGQAVEKARTGKYDLILMDIQMPVMDGFAATRLIRTFEPNVPIVALTAHALIHAADEAMRAGCNGYVAKPVERDELLNSIRQFVPHDVEPKEKFSPDSAVIRWRFLQNRRNDEQKIHAAREAGDLETLRQIGHNCKGCAKSYGFPEIGQAASAIEAGARTNDLEMLDKAIQEFTRLVEQASAKEAADSTVLH